MIDPELRPVSAVADFTEIREVTSVEIHEDQKDSSQLLFDPEHNLEDRILKNSLFHSLLSECHIYTYSFL